jgi:hypothetical protein
VSHDIIQYARGRYRYLRLNPDKALRFPAYLDQILGFEVWIQLFPSFREPFYECRHSAPLCFNALLAKAHET